MKFIAHRINTCEELATVPTEYGVEIDIRDSGDELILCHDPFGNGENLEAFLKQYNHGTLILNVKSERIEFRIQELLKKYSITDYFFLDSSFPMIYLLSKNGERNIAIRFSEFEGLDTILSMKGLIDWVWVDCFTKLPLDKNNYKILKEAGFKLCLVSPELQGRAEDIPEHYKFLSENKLLPDAVCTKIYNMQLWQN